MKKIVFTIKLRLALAFGACATSLLIIAALGTAMLAHVSAESDTSYDQRIAQEVLVAFAWAGCAAAVCGCLYIQRIVGGKLNRMGSKFEEIARTLDLSKRSSSPQMDEFGRSAVAFDNLMRRVEDAIAAVRISADAVASASHEIASGNMNLSARTEEQASSLEEAASSMKQLTETVKLNSDSSQRAKALALNATELAAVGNDAVQAMVRNMETIHASSNKISEITGVIEEIAFQSNILALNASVEAARAGGQGKGFSVVAGEVRSLAQRSASAAKEIKELIASSVGTIQDGSQQAIDVSVTMGKIEHAIKQVSGTVDEIAGASEDQRRSIVQVTQLVVQMDETTLQNAALVEQAAAAAQSLEVLASTLRSSVSSFKFAETVRKQEGSVSRKL